MNQFIQFLTNYTSTHLIVSLFYRSNSWYCFSVCWTRPLRLFHLVTWPYYFWYDIHFKNSSPMFTTAYCGRLHADNVPNKLNGKKYPKYKKLHEINSLIFREMIQCIVKSLMYFPSMIPIVQKQPKNTSTVLHHFIPPSPS